MQAMYNFTQFQISLHTQFPNVSFGFIIDTVLFVCDNRAIV